MRRSFGWVQNPGSLATLKKVVASLVQGTGEHDNLFHTRLPLIRHNGLISDEDYTILSGLEQCDQYPYPALKGRGAGGGSRSKALCSGLVQAMIDAQSNQVLHTVSGHTYTGKKPYTDDWSAFGYISFAVSLGFLVFDEATDSLHVSESGRALAFTPADSDQEHDLMGEALLSYPPTTRILHTLDTRPGAYFTKFELGAKLGFKGEKGFTSIPQNVYAATLGTASPSERAKIRSNLEGDSDKYARGIASWLKQLGWVTTQSVHVNETYLGHEYHATLQGYAITIQGQQAIKRARGYSSNPKIPKRVLYEMLATKASAADMVRKRRALILQSLQTSGKTAAQIVDFLAGHGINLDETAVIDNVQDLENIGITIARDNGRYTLSDTIVGLAVPAAPATTDSQVLELKDRVRNRLRHIDHDYLALIDLAYSGKKNQTDARDFEIKTASLFTQELGFYGEHLGGSNRPDVVVFHDRDGLIIDNKSYHNGFAADKDNTDEMGRYIEQNHRREHQVPPNEWWKIFGPTVTNISYLFITSYLKGNYAGQLRELSLLHHTHGGAVPIEDLLYMADEVKGGTMTKHEFCEATRTDGGVLYA